MRSFFSSGSNYDIWMCLVPKKMKENEGKWDGKRRKKNWGDGFFLVQLAQVMIFGCVWFLRK